MSVARVALVTGGRRGIGRAIALEMASSGFDIAICDVTRDDDANQTLAQIEAMGRRAIFAKCDIAQLETHDALVAQVVAELGAIDCLVNNAGVQSQERGDMLELSVASLDRLLGVNTRGTFFLTQRVMKEMAKVDSGGVFDRSIIFISSGNAAIATTTQADYCISKASISMMNSLFAIRGAEYGIAVHEVRPGIIRTSMTDDVYDKYNSMVEGGAFAMRRWGQPQDVGRCVATLAAGGMPYSTGDAYFVDGGIHIRRT